MNKTIEILEIEKEKFYDLFEKRNALINLEKIIDSSNVLYRRLRINLIETTKAEERWWNEIAEKYNLKLENEKWIINFKDNTLFRDYLGNRNYTLVFYYK